MTVSATDVPNKFDCIINGEGYLFAPSDAGLPPSVFGVKPEFSYTPTFVTRQNTQGDYGDNQQDFWLTATQRDWSLGEQQRYYRQANEDSQRRYWQGTGVDVSEVGKAQLRPVTSQTTTFGGSIFKLHRKAGVPVNDAIYATSATNLYEISTAGTITDNGAHGLGAEPVCMSDGGSTGLYFSTLSGGTVGVRKWSGAAFSTFSATAAHTLAFLNNTLYGVGGALPGDTLKRYDTAGTATTIFTWQDAAGAAVPIATPLLPFGGKLLILRPADAVGSSLWLYDGTAPALVETFPRGFFATQMCQSLGTVFISGFFAKRLSGVDYIKPAIFFYANGTTGLLWKASDFMLRTASGTAGNIGTAPCIATEFGNGIVFTDDTRGTLNFYDPANGGISTIGSYTVTVDLLDIASSASFLLHSRRTTQPWRYPADGYVTSATVTTSLFDFDSSLTKLMRGIKVEFDSATDGNGGTVDISYRVGDVDGSYTSLQTGVTSGTEYTLSGVTGRSISVKVTLNKGTSTAGPVLKRISVRAAPQQTTFRQGKYVLYLGGSSKRDPMEGQMLSLRDDTRHRKSGATMAANIITAATSASPIAVTDGPNGTVSNVVCDLANFQLTQIKPGEYVCVFPWREV